MSYDPGMQMMRVLVTGFEPFADSRENPSQAVARQLDVAGPWSAGIELHTADLPVDAALLPGVLDEVLARVDPAVVVLLGESAKAAEVTLERLAVNLLDFRIKDNAGQQIEDQPIEPGGPDALFATLPVKAIRDELEHAGLPAALSMSAGTFLCNQAMYLTLRWGQRAEGPQSGGLRSVGFVHLPSLPSQVVRGDRCGASMALDDAAAAVRIVVDVANNINLK